MMRSFFKLSRRTPFTWLDELLPDIGEMSPVRRIRGDSSIAKLRRGALLNWVFDEPDFETSHRLLVYLTDRESQLVFDTPKSIGLLEAVRPTLRNAGAILWVDRPDETVARQFLIPRYASERAFIDDLMLVAGSAPEHRPDTVEPNWQPAEGIVTLRKDDKHLVKTSLKRFALV